VIDAGDPARLAGFAADGPARDVHVVDRYLDTAARDGRLAGTGMRARLRTEDGHVVLAVKDEGRRDGDVHARLELQGPASDAIDPAVWPDSAARDRLVALTGGAPLVVVAALSQVRLTRRLRRGDTVVVLSLDAVTALHGARPLATRTELEAELAEGDPAALAELAAALRAVPGVTDAFGAKSRFARAALDADIADPGGVGTER
jgi:inorganic triphosphatase YgiF